jgi:hypothetical protein
MDATRYTYEDCIHNSEKVAWRIDDVLPAGSRLDFTRAFLPEVMVRSKVLVFLSEMERLKLNHIFANAYLNLFAFVEEYIAADIVRHANAEQFGDDHALRALLRFADEEVKHRMLFQTFGRMFVENFGSPCGVLANAQEVAGVILDKKPMAVMLVTYHLELITQKHYVEFVKGDRDEDLDALFANLLRYHWLEESQHAKIDVLELEKMRADSSDKVVDEAIQDYVDIVHAFDGLLKAQGEMDAESLQKAIGRVLPPSERVSVAREMHQSYRNLFLTMGLDHASFQEMLERLSSTAGPRVLAMRPGLAQ